MGPPHSEPLLVSLAAQLETDLRWYDAPRSPGGDGPGRGQTSATGCSATTLR